MNKWRDFTCNAGNESRYVWSGRWNQEIQALTWISAPDLPSNHGSWFFSTATSLQPWCCLVHTQVLSAKLLTAPTHQVFIKIRGKLPSLSWIYTWTQWQKGIFHQSGSMKPRSGKAQEINGRGNAELQWLPPHWATPGSPQHPGPFSAIYRSIPRTRNRIPNTPSLPHTSKLQNAPFPFCSKSNRLTWNRDFEPNSTSFVPPGWCFLGLVGF